jgi:DNA-binding NarL/FixJ family response regulator
VRLAFLVVLDLMLSNFPGPESVRSIKAIRPEAKVLILSMHEDIEYLRRALSTGAEGYLIIQSVGKELLQAVEMIRAGNVYVSPGLAGLAPTGP